jgi:hypothetical protein
MNSIIEYLEKNDLKATAKRQLECFEPYSKDEGPMLEPQALYLYYAKKSLKCLLKLEKMYPTIIQMLKT